MKYLVPTLFLVVGIINFIPIVGALSGEQLQKLYRLSTLSSDLELLMRHRAVLLGIVGSLVVTASFASSLRLTATLLGLLSMLSFVALVFLTNSENPNLVRIAWIDVAASALLLIAFILHFSAAES